MDSDNSSTSRHLAPNFTMNVLVFLKVLDKLSCIEAIRGLIFDQMHVKISDGGGDIFIFLTRDICLRNASRFGI